MAKEPFQITASMRAFCVLQAEIGVAGRMRPAIARDLAPHAHMAERVLQGALERAARSETDHSWAFEGAF